MALDVLDGALVVVIACVVGALELIGRHPDHAGLVIRTTPGRRYLVVNALAGAVAYAVAVLLEVRFAGPNRLILVVTCGSTAIAVLRSSPVTRAGLAGPASILQKLKVAYAVELETAQKVKDAKRAGVLVAGLDWETDREALVVTCQTIAGQVDPGDLVAMATEIKSLEKTDLDAGLCMFILGTKLRDKFGDAILEAAAEKLRDIKAKSADRPS